ncbi:hypothetical protein ACH41E_30295 [Streptomyces sp. NPDC020412]|uniref:hypothetical protein n=1 Tax=Streptomyces sp. NPDC020412 TaxID=3365073 RepID=UPI003794DD22
MASVQDEIPGFVVYAVRQPDHDESSIQARFEEFHRLNPWVLTALEKLTADYLKQGAARVGVGMLFEVLRYQYALATRGDDFRLNNSYRSRYARLLIQRHPQWESAFEVRALRAD